MFRKILGWFRKDHAKASAKILSAFDKIKTDLQALSLSANKAKSANLTRINELQKHNASLDATVAQNMQVVKNLSNLMGKTE